MSAVELEVEVRAPIESVWSVVVDIERYPNSMANVRSVDIIAVEGTSVRKSSWSVTLKNSLLRWTQVEQIDSDRFVLAFRQVGGDLEHLEGSCRLEKRDANVTLVRLHMTFEIGIPVLGRILNPVAQRALRESCRDMLLGIGREVAGSGGAGRSID